MTLAAYSHDKGFLGDVATSSGWAAFTTWANTLDEDLYQEIHHLAENGWEQEIDDLRDQLGAALEDDDEPRPSPGVARTARSLLALVNKIADDDALVVSDGVGVELRTKKGPLR